jgi:mRNA interferase HicA
LIKLFEKAGWYYNREGSNHTVYTDGNRIEQIPRHREVNEVLAKHLINKYNL